jgi:TetR/AcrR family transcriptional regulator, copper-responsive repressor
MVQKESRPRGRPRAFDPDEALRRALDCFWKRGYSATSLDDLSAAMGMNRPSIYAAFGDKKALYLAATELYQAKSRASSARTFAEAPTIRAGLRQMLSNAIANYTAGDFGQRGCFMVGTAVTEAASEPDVKAVLEASNRELETSLTARFREARTRGEPIGPVSPEVQGRMMTDLIYGLALRARAGAPREDLERAAEASLAAIWGA